MIYGRCFLYMKRKRVRKTMNIKLRLAAVVAVLLLLITVAVKSDSRLRVLTNNYAGNKAKIIANSVINENVYKTLNDMQITYSDLMKINCDGEGTVTSVEYDTVTIAKLKSNLTANIQKGVGEKKSVRIDVPVGTLTGNQFLNNRGPSIKISMNISSAVYAKMSSKFISAGINQTLHQITLKITSDIYFVMPWYRTTGNFESEFTIAETVIVGKVPEAYTNVIEYPGSDMAGYLFDYGAQAPD